MLNRLRTEISNVVVKYDIHLGPRVSYRIKKKHFQLALSKFKRSLLVYESEKMDKIWQQFGMHSCALLVLTVYPPGPGKYVLGNLSFIENFLSLFLHPFNSNTLV